MARHEAEREDLMREATALRERVQMGVPGETEPVVAGFHRDGRLSLYFGADPVFQFDSAGRLRRAYAGGDLYRSQGATLARLRRSRSDMDTTLERHDLDADELKKFLARMRNRLALLMAALESKQIEFLCEVPADAEIGARLMERLPQACLGRLSAALK